MADPLGMDEELQSLLTDLEQNAGEGPLPPAEPVPEQALELEPDPEQDHVAADIISTVSDPILSDPAVELESDVPDLAIDSPSTNMSDLKDVVEKFDKDYGEVQANLKRDRGRIDEVIDILLKRVKTNKDSEADTISLVKALSVLSDTNGHSVKLLDSRSKLLSATKSAMNAMQTNINITGTDAELQNLLSQPAEVDV